MPAAVDLTGHIAITIRTRGDSVDAVQLESSRPVDLTGKLFAGKPVDHLLRTLPALYNVCATAQGLAALGASEQAAGIVASTAHQRARQALLLAETAREHLFRILTGWNQWLGRRPGGQTLGLLGSLRRDWATAFYPELDPLVMGGGHLRPDRAALPALGGRLRLAITEVLGRDVTPWLEVEDFTALDAWCRSGDSVCQALVREVVDNHWCDLGRNAVVVLPPIAAELLGERLTGTHAETFAARPDWAGHPCETGALERESTRPLIADLVREFGNGLLARLAARLTELASLPDRIDEAYDVPVENPDPARAQYMTGCGTVQIDAARGRLVHRIRLEQGIVREHRILAPTEWNFHPHGVLVAGLKTLPAGAALPALARLLVDAVDPCVESAIEVTADA